MNHTEGTFKSADGLDLFYQAWLPDGKPKAVFATVHGYGEHSGRYLNPVEHFVPLGYALYAFDQRGHGRSPGQRGHVNRFNDYLFDVQEFLRLVRAAQPASKLFLLGHSMGGLVALAYAIHHPQDIDAVVASSPMLGLAVKAPGWKVVLGRVLSSLAPTFQMTNDLPAADLSHDPAVAAAYVQDPHNHFVVTPRWFTEAEAAMAATVEHAGELQVPLLLIYAAADKIADPQVSPVFFERVTHPDKTIHAYKDYYHEIFNEVGKEAVFKDMEQWLASHV